MDYDSETCITAGELRAAGFPVLESIPDSAWVCRDSIKYTGVDVGVQEDDPHAIKIRVGAEFTEPFNWVEIKMVI